jgi:hypothetical protein
MTIEITIKNHDLAYNTQVIEKTYARPVHEGSAPTGSFLSYIPPGETKRFYVHHHNQLEVTKGPLATPVP